MEPVVSQADPESDGHPVQDNAAASSVHEKWNSAATAPTWKMTMTTAVSQFTVV